jgi:hypothetical protein
MLEVSIQFKSLEDGSQFKMNGQRFFKLDKMTAIANLSTTTSLIRPKAIVELEVSDTVLNDIKKLLSDGEGGGVISYNTGLNQSEIAAIINTL